MNTLGVIGTLGDGADADAGGVAGQDGFLGGDARQPLEETLFQCEVLRNGFNHEICMRDLRIQVCGTAQTLQSRCQLSRAQQALLPQRAQEGFGLEKPFVGAF